MQQVKIVLKDGSEKNYPKGISVLEVAEDLSRRLAKEALIGKVNGNLVDLYYNIEEDAVVEILTFDDDEAKHAFWHSTSHVMAQAVKRLFPETKIAIGPAIEQGFYYDFDREESFTPEDLEKIEAEMKKIIKEKFKFERSQLSKSDALRKLKAAEEPYKAELVEELPESEEISFYKQGEFTDLCAGPHIPSTDRIKAIKLTSLAGAYWRGDEHNKMLQRIYGISFPKKSMLDKYLKLLEEAKKRDHRKLGKELDIFSLQEEGPRLSLFPSKGSCFMESSYQFLEIRT